VQEAGVCASKLRKENTSITSVLRRDHQASGKTDTRSGLIGRMLPCRWEGQKKTGSE